MAGAGAHRVVDHHDRQAGDRIAVRPQEIHLADALVERAALQRDPKRIEFVLLFFFLKSARARVFLSLVGEDAVMRLIGDLAGRFAVGGSGGTSLSYTTGFGR